MASPSPQILEHTCETPRQVPALDARGSASIRPMMAEYLCIQLVSDFSHRQAETAAFGKQPRHSIRGPKGPAQSLDPPPLSEYSVLRSRRRYTPFDLSFQFFHNSYESWWPIRIVTQRPSTLSFSSTFSHLWPRFSLCSTALPATLLASTCRLFASVARLTPPLLCFVSAIITLFAQRRVQASTVISPTRDLLELGPVSRFAFIFARFHADLLFVGGGHRRTTVSTLIHSSALASLLRTRVRRLQALSKVLSKRQDPNPLRILHPSWNADRQQQPHLFD